MKLRLILACSLFLFSLAVFAQDFEIKIDAQKDAFYNTLTGPSDGWLYIPPEAFNNNGSATDPGPTDEYDLSANWYSAWDNTYLYIYVDVMDDQVYQTSGTYWQNDCFDAKLDPDYTDVTDTNQVFCFAMTCEDSVDVTDPSWLPGVGNLVETVGGGWVQNGDSTAIKSVTKADYARKLRDDGLGYILECRLKWDWFVTNNKGPIVPDVGLDIGFGVSISDNDNGAQARDNSIEWAAQLLDNIWIDCANMGYMELMADHKIKYVPESLIDPSRVNPNPEMYNPLTDVSDEPATVKSFVLSQNYPNPFNPSTTILYSLQKMSRVKITVYDLLGHEVATLVDGMKAAGTYKVRFNGSNLSSGIYIYKLQSEGKVISRKMALIK